MTNAVSNAAPGGPDGPGRAFSAARRTLTATAAGALMWVGGCGSDEPEPLAPREVVRQLVDQAARDQVEISTGGAAGADETVNIAVREVPDRLDPFGGASPWARRVMDDLVFEGLTRRAADAFPFAAPAFADRCIADPPAEPRAVFCQLPTDRTFHDGSKVTVVDVLYSVQHWLDPRRAGLQLRFGLTGLQDVAEVDGPPGEEGSGGAPWIRIGFSEPQPLALELIAEIKIVPEARHRAQGRGFGLAPVGTGPMKVAGLDADRLVLEAVRDDADPRTPQRIVLSRVIDGAAGLTALRRGEIHVLADVAPAHLPFELTKPGMAPRFVGYTLSPPRYDLLVYNARRSTLAKAEMRAAIDDGLPRAVIDEAYPGASRGGGPPVDADDPVSIDLAALEEAGPAATMGMAGLPASAAYDDAAIGRANAALDAQGWPTERGLRRRGTTSLRLVLTWDGAGGRSRRLANAVRDGLREVGVHVPYATASWSYIFGLLRRGDFDLGLVRLATHSDADLYPYFHSRGASNLSGVSDAELDAALEQYRVARTRAERLDALRRTGQRLATLRPVSVLHAPAAVMLVNRRLEALEFEDDLPRLDKIRLGPEPDWIAGR